MIDTGSLPALRAIDQYGSVIAAADALGFTPSAVSQQIKRLERRTGVALLERVGRGVLLTEAGRRLADDGAELLTRLERMEADLHAGADIVSGRMRLTTFSTAMRGLAAPAAGELQRRHPDLDVALAEEEPWDTVELVARGAADVGLAHRWGDVALQVPDHLVETVIGHDVADVVLRRDHPLVRDGAGSATALELSTERWIATPRGTICREWLERMHDGTGRRPHVAHQAREFDSHLAMVEAGLGIALIPRLGRATLGADLTTLEVTEPRPTRTVSAFHRRSQQGSPAVAAVLDALRGCWQASSEAQNRAEASA